MISLFDSIQKNGLSSKHSGTTKPKFISTPMRKMTQQDVSHSITRRPTLPNGSGITLYTVIKPYHEDTLSLSLSSSSSSNTFHLKEGDLVQLISKEKDPNYVYVKLINSLGEGLVPLSHLEEYYHLPSALINNNEIIAQTNKLSVTSLQTINSISHHHLMELTPPTSPSTIGSNTFSLGSRSRNSRSSASSPNLSSTKKQFDHSVSLISMCVGSVETKDDRTIYKIKITNQWKQDTFRELYYQELYHLHLDLISHQQYNNEELALPRLPPPLPLHSKEIQRTERIAEIDQYIQSMFKTLSMEPNTSILKKNWIDFILRCNEPTDDGDIIMKVKVLYHGDYHAFKCPFNEIYNLLKLQDTISSKLHHDEGFAPSTVFTAVIDGWYKVNLTNEDIYKEVITKTKESLRFTLEVYD